MDNVVKVPISPVSSRVATEASLVEIKRELSSHGVQQYRTQQHVGDDRFGPLETVRE